MSERSFQVAVDEQDGSVVITMVSGNMHACMNLTAEEFHELVPLINGAFGDSKMASSHEHPEHVITLDSQVSGQWFGAPSYRWHCTCGETGRWGLSQVVATSQGALHIAERS